MRTYANHIHISDHMIQQTLNDSTPCGSHRKSELSGISDQNVPDNSKINQSIYKNALSISALKSCIARETKGYLM